MTRMFLAVPRDSVIPEGHSVTYLPDGTMVDFDQDVRCETCRYFHKAVDEDYAYCARLVTFGDMLLIDPDFGCKAWGSKGE